MKNFNNLSTKEIHFLLTDLGNLTDDEIDDAYDELDNRERAMELFDWTEQDARAAAEDKYEMWRREY